ncbi:SMP-30/gluconolactonase/LRE family protein [Paucibacter sp. M5-1]|uniref:SMP-30/gluconolactonase/LRE family protein n=1 Tax=Paucibacter sp. M5-1 TaxID=3015998 RepID=UPI0022B8F384|nr:SMP-30/gluconolactonase/LRE family protein [Paucibacter sp. M5-1]MCZ7883050.1 SMP-30/gluconolactonase/LRE family protein [Paucibacter sp. M5-1]
MSTSPECLWPLGAELGEGPVWRQAQSPADAALYFVDIKGRQIHRCAADGTGQQSWAAPSAIGFVQPLADGDFVAGLQDGLYRFSPGSGDFKALIAVDAHQPGNRLNDANVDAQGRLWFGTMDNAEIEPSGSLYRVGADGKLRAEDCGYVITNGPAQSPDGRHLYHTDTLAQKVYAFDLSPTGTLSNKRLLITLENGYPDGTTVDAEGHLWICLFAGHRIERYTPKGRLVQTVAMPCANITKLAFGGTDLHTAFVTTAWKGLSPAERVAQPLAGGLFSFRVNTPGLPAHPISQGFSS